jgi:hypothetical protein
MLLCDLLRLNLTDQNQRDERAFLINELLEDADRASKERVLLSKWWWGTEIERAWARLHEVRHRTVDLLDETDLLARAAFVSGHGSSYLKTDDKRLQHLDTLRRQAAQTVPPQIPAGLRSAIVEVMRATRKETDQTNQEARYFRNRLLTASIVSFLFAVVIVVVQWRMGNTRLLEPPKDWHGSAWAFLVVVMIFGSVGALFTTIPVMAKIPSDFSPFNLPYQQALLKLVFGPLVAVIGIAVLSAGKVGVTAPGTWPALLLFAVVFGAGQHAVTRYVDDRANVILAATAPGATSKTA